MQIVSAIVNFQRNRRPLEYYTEPLNDLITCIDSEDNIDIYVDDDKIVSAINKKENVNITYVDLMSMIDGAFEREQERRKYFKQQQWYELTQIYMAKSLFLEMSLNSSHSRFAWIDAGFPCSHLFMHDYRRYHNIYARNWAYIRNILLSDNFISQGWICGHSYGVNMMEVYNVLQLEPNGSEHVTQALYSLDRLQVHDLKHSMIEMYNIFLDNGWYGVDENLIIPILIIRKDLMGSTYDYSKLRRTIMKTMGMDKLGATCNIK